MATAPPSIGVSTLPIPATLPQPGPTPGEVLAPALNDVAQAGGEVALLRKNQQQAAQASAAMVAFNNDKGDIRAQVAALRQSSDFDPATFGDQVRSLISDRIGQNLGSIADPEVRQRLAPVFSDWASSEIATAKIEGGQAAAAQLTENHLENRNQTATGLVDSPRDYSWALTADRTLIGTYKNLPPEAQEKLFREDAALFSHMSAYGTIKQDPQTGLTLLQSGFYDDHMRPEDKLTLTSFAETEIHKQQVEARQQITLQREDALTKIKHVLFNVDNHIPVEPADFEAARALIARPELKLQDYADSLGKAQVVNGVGRTYQSALPITISNDLDALNTKIAQQGGKADPALVIQRDALQSQLAARREEMNRDPMGLYARTGGQVAPLNPMDPASIAARRQAWQQAQGRLGPNTGPLQLDEASQFEQQLAKGGASGRIDVLNTLANFGGDMGVAAARQIAPGNTHLQAAVALAAMGPAGRAVARDSLLGADAIAAHKGIINDAAAQQVWGRLSLALTGLTPDAQRGIFEGSLGVFATRQARAGHTEAWPKMGDDAQRTALTAAVQAFLGAQSRPNGEQQGGIANYNGHFTGLPSTMTKRELETAIARATPTDFARAAGGVTPVYANHQTPSIPEFKAMQLEMVADGLYRVKLGNSYLGRGDGKGLYEFDATKLPH